MASSSANRAPTATKGGASSIATPANSGGSGIFGGNTVGATNKGGADGGSSGAVGGASKTTPVSTTGTRRLSQDGSGMFGNLSNLKRNSQDQGSAQRKSSLSEQRPAPGVFGQMWNNFTKGPSSPTK